MEYHLVEICTFLLFICTTVAQAFLAGHINDKLSSYRDSQNLDTSMIMDALAKLYVPHCLRIKIVPADYVSIESLPGTDKILIRDSDTDKKNYNMEISTERPQIIINQNESLQVQKTIDYIVKNKAKVTPYSCVTYMLQQLPDSSHLPLLTEESSINKFPRYFLVHTQNSTEAEQFLLDQRLRKELNVAALVQEKKEENSHWRVLIRQLLHPSGSPQVLTVNRWSRDTGVTSTENIFPEQMANFYGQRFRGVALRYKPFVDYQEVEGTIVVKPKPSVDLFILDTIAKKLNFTYEIALPVDGQWGYLKDDGFFTGVVGDIQHGRANFSLNLNIILKRAQAIDFTRMYYAEPMTFITAKSPPSARWRKIITPFTTAVWLCVLVSVSGGSLLYHFIYHAQATLASSHLLSSSAFMNVLASFLSQALYTFPKLFSARVFLGAWFLYAFLVTSYYKTSLTSTLAVPIQPASIDTLEQLYQSGVIYGINARKSVTYQLFSTSDIPLYKKMFSRMDYNTYPESMRLAGEGNYAYIGFRTPLTLQMVLHNNKPNRKVDLHVAPDESFPGGYAWALPKGATYLKSFNKVMWRCVQAGLINKWLGDFFSLHLKEPQDQRAKTTETEGEQSTVAQRDDGGQVVLSLNHLQGSFFILMLGFAGGAVLLVFEILLARQKPT